MFIQLMQEVPKICFPFWLTLCGMYKRMVQEWEITEILGKVFDNDLTVDLRVTDLTFLRLIFFYFRILFLP